MILKAIQVWLFSLYFMASMLFKNIDHFFLTTSLGKIRSAMHSFWNNSFSYENEIDTQTMDLYITLTFSSLKNLTLTSK